MVKPLRQFAFFVLLAATAAGCASGPRYDEYRAQLKPPGPGLGRVWFYRTSVLGLAVQPRVRLDDVDAGYAVPGGFFKVDVQPGDHVVKCTTEWTHQASIMVSTNQDSYVRLGMMMGLFVGHVVPEEVSESAATEEMRHLHLAAHD